MTNNMTNKLSALTALLLISASAQATVITYGNRAAFEANPGTIISDDYENAGYGSLQSDAQMSAVVGETQYTATGHSNVNIVFSTGSNILYCAGCNGSFRLDFSSTSVSGAGGVFGVGFDYFNSQFPLYHAFVTFVDNTTVDFALNQVSFPNLNFFGITADELIKTIHLGLANGGATQEGSFGQDNLTLIGNIRQTVPEPTTLALMGLGLAGVGAMRRKLRV